MVMVDLYGDEKEKSHHQSAVRNLARDLGMPIQEIGALYERALEEIKKTARVKDYLSIFASRQVKEFLHRKKVA